MLDVTMALPVVRAVASLREIFETHLVPYRPTRSSRARPSRC